MVVHTGLGYVYNGRNQSTAPPLPFPHLTLGVFGFRKRDVSEMITGAAVMTSRVNRLWQSQCLGQLSDSCYSISGQPFRVLHISVERKLSYWEAKLSTLRN